MRVPNFVNGLRASKGRAGAGVDALQQATPEAPVAKTRRRLFTKYVALFVAVVCIALVSNGVFDVFFYYQEHKASLIRIQREQAEAAAAKIKRMIGILSLGGVSNLAPGDLLSECIKSVSAHH